jgi:hypothetical protein
MFGSTESVVPGSLLVRRSRLMSFSPKTSAEAPPQEPFLGSNAAKARERKLARKLWQRRRRLGEKVRGSGGAISRALENAPLAHG